MSRKILVTPRSLTRNGHPALRRLAAAGYEPVFCAPGALPGEAELMRLLPGCVGYLAGVEPVTARVLSRAENLKVVSRNGTGVDNIDLEAAAAAGIEVRNAPGANANGVAELTVALMFALARSVPRSDQYLKYGKWERWQGIELRGRTLGLVGCGRIGGQVARLALGLGLNALGYDPCPAAETAALPGFAYAPLDRVIRESDFLSLHCPPRPGDAALLTRENIALIKPGGFVVNTARASLIDADAALAALDSGRIAGLAIDVFAVEPPGRGPLVTHPLVIATPHLGGYTRESVDRAAEAAVDNLLAALAGPAGKGESTS